MRHDINQNAHARTTTLILALACTLAGTAGSWAQPFMPKTIQTSRLDVDATGSALSAPTALNSNNAMSAFGRYVVFATETGIDPNDTNQLSDIYVRDNRTGSVTLVSVDSNGTQANAESGMANFGPCPPFGCRSGAAISWTGRFVVFNSFATNLDTTADTNGFVDTFWHDRDVAGDGIFDQPGDIATMRVSIASDGSQTNSVIRGFPSVSACGRYVSFATSATNLDPANAPGIFVHDTILRTTTRVNVSTTGAVDNGTAGPSLVMISPNGRFVLFNSDGSNLVPGDTNNVTDVFLRDMDTNADGILNQPNDVATFRLSVDSNGTQANGASTASHLSYDGAFAVFNSAATNLVPGDTNTANDVFVRDVFMQTTTRVNVDANGNEADTGAGNAVLSSDARFVAFWSNATNLGPNNHVGATRLFLADRDVSEDGTFDQAGDTSAVIAGVLPDASLALIGAGPGGSDLAITADGRAVAFFDQLTAGTYLREFGVDTDGDGLLDSWETNLGIDVDNDGDIDNDDLALPNANPNRKDIYVEIDVMQPNPNANPPIATLAPSAPTLTTIRQLFANVPAGAAQNPDGSAGITLHLFVDETTIPWQQFNPTNPWGPAPVGQPAASAFTFYEQNFLGTTAERARPTANAIRNAKRNAYHYCLFADAVAGSTVGGQGLFPGNAFYIALGNWNNGGTQSDRAGVFMHELGHNLGLNHGGWDPSNYKPNYPSVMNYTHTVPSACWAPWTLDFSSAQWPTLDENNLNEFNGVGGRPFTRIPFAPPPTPTSCQITAFETGAVDWDQDGFFTTNAVADINTIFTGQTPSPGEVLQGAHDWPNLWFTMRGHPNFFAAPPGGLPLDDDLTPENLNAASQLPQHTWTATLDDLPPGPANLKGGWEVWCDGGNDAMITSAQFRSPPHSILISDEDPVGFGSDLVHNFTADGCHWTFSAWTYIPFDAIGVGHIVLLNEYCVAQHNWSSQVAFDADANLVRSAEGPPLPLLREQWVEYRVDIDLDNDRFSEFYDGQPLALDRPWTTALGTPGSLAIAGVDLFAETITAMYIDDLALELVACPPPPCEADRDLNGIVDVFDLLFYLDGWFLADPAADLDFNGLINVFDLLAFLDLWFLGC